MVSCKKETAGKIGSMGLYEDNTDICLDVSRLGVTNGHQSFELFCFYFLVLRSLLHWSLLFPGTAFTNSWAPELWAGKESQVKNMTTNKGFGCPTPESQGRMFKWKNLCWITSTKCIEKVDNVLGKKRETFLYLLK